MSTKPEVHEADFVIVGTGAGGATAARVLAGAGHSVLMVEEGAWVRPERKVPLLQTMSRMMRGFGTAATRGASPIPLLQGRCVGGSTAVNSGIIWRMPEDVADDWREHHGLADLVDPHARRRIFETLERELEVTVTRDSVLGGNSQRMARAAKLLGLKGQPMQRNAARCEGSAQCLQGCPAGARQSMDTSFVPRAISFGATLLTNARVRRVTVRNGRAIGVEGVRVDETTRAVVNRFTVRAKRAVILAAGAVQTPLLLRRSGLRRNVGEGFRAHPGAAVVGMFPDPVRIAFGATQGYEVPMRARRFKLESLGLPPEMLAARLPGAGPAWQERLAKLDHFAQWCVQVRMRAVGRVRASFGDEPRVSYVPLAGDLAILREALALLSRMMFAVGATEVYPGVAGIDAIDSVAQVERIERVPLSPKNFHLVASHLFGGACAGADAARSVVGPDLRTHQVASLYVMDASTFPTNMGVNPQHSIMAVAYRASERLANASRLAVAS